jgi:solute carrier family 50 (sugar transporter)
MIMWLSPLKAILLARKSRQLGDLNPIPFVVTVFNCIAWVIYANMMRDYFMFWANAPGLVLGLFYSLTCMSVLARQAAKCAKAQEQLNQCESLLVFSVGFWCLMSMVANLTFSQERIGRLDAAAFIGTLSCAAALAYYAAPLSTMVSPARSYVEVSMSTYHDLLSYDA